MTISKRAAKGRVNSLEQTKTANKGIRLLLPKSIEARCTKIANAVVPEYNNGSYSCTGIIAKRWQAAWDAACISIGYEPKAVALDLRK